MSAKLPLVAFTNREGPRSTWTQYDFFAAGLEDGMITLIFEERDDEALAPFEAFGFDDVETPEFLRSVDVVATVARPEDIAEMVPDVARSLIEDMAAEMPVMFGPLEEDETREDRHESLYWSGYVMSVQVINGLGESIERSAAELEAEAARP